MKSKPKLKKLLSAALTAVISLGFAVPAAAAPVDPTTVTAASITKSLVMPVNTDTPAATFKFTAAPTALNGSNAAADVLLVPAIPSAALEISYTQGDTGTEENGVKTVNKETANILEGITWPKEGVYSYTITEQGDTYSIADSFREKMTYAQSSYTMDVYVTRDNQNKLVVYAVGAKILAADAFYTGETAGTKIDPTPGGDPGATGSFSGMVFTNKYLKNKGGTDITDPANTVLSVSKMVKGLQADTTKDFAFSVAVYMPKTVEGDPSYNASYHSYIVENREGAVPLGTESPIIFASGVAQQISLKHNQKLIFTDLPVGSRFHVTETAAAGYTPSYTLAHNGGTAETVSGAENQELSISEEKYIGENASSLSYVNTYRDITPTGIIVDNLPYITLIGMAALALAGFILLKARSYRSRED